MQKKGILKLARTAIHTIDFFPLDISLRENNNDKYTTWIGSLLSLMMLVIVSHYGHKKYDIMINRDDTTYKEVDVDRQIPYAFDASENGGFFFEAFSL